MAANCVGIPHSKRRTAGTIMLRLGAWAAFLHKARDAPLGQSESHVAAVCAKSLSKHLGDGEGDTLNPIDGVDGVRFRYGPPALQLAVYKVGLMGDLVPPLGD